LSYLIFFVPLLLIATFFSFQLITIAESLPKIGENLQSGFNLLVQRANKLIPIIDLNSTNIIGDVNKDDLKEPLLFIGQGLISTTAILTGAGLTLLYSFFFLFYSKSFNNFIVYQFEKSERSEIKDTLVEMKKSIQSYVTGLGLVVIILSVMNSIGLSIIGIDYAIFWGCLAGMLSIIPYVGTMVGGLLPFIFALSTADANWQPIAVLIYYLMIQQVEGNFITPKIVGDKVDINPFFAILAIVFLGSFWGVAGIILALPIISILRILLSNFESTLPYSILMSSGIREKKGIFKKMADD